MIIGFGIDTVNIERCKNWHTYSHKRLNRILSDQEIAYCLTSPKLSAERFAVRFAAREAFFKAWNSAFPDQYIPLLTVCRAIKVVHGANNLPQLAVDWPFLAITPPPHNDTFLSYPFSVGCYRLRHAPKYYRLNKPLKTNHPSTITNNPIKNGDFKSTIFNKTIAFDGFLLVI